VAPAILPRAWRLGSYSSLAYGARHEGSAVDHDARQAQTHSTSDSEPFAADPTADSSPDILQFPRGAAAGDCLHNQVVRVMGSTLFDAFRSGASDIHVESNPSGARIQYRLDGVLVPGGRIDGREMTGRGKAWHDRGAKPSTRRGL
jgi:type II secretory ATPase GspE/PulE/Tfp pilus assembly ATPase PilB-like protein